MALGSVVLELGLIVTTMLVTATLGIVGIRPLGRALRGIRLRIGVIALPAFALVSVLFVRWGTRDVFHVLTWRVFDTNITPLIFELEQTVFPTHPVVALQSLESPELTSIAAFVYIYGYAFMLAFPAVAYFALEDQRIEHLSTLLLAFAVNYGIGLVLYVLFIAYGPRNFDPMFGDILYRDYPTSGYLTHTVNQSENVFPSLHTSMAMTVFFLAWHSREEYPLWVPISGTLAIGVVLSTMYLGIHWASDVVAGVLLAVVSVYVGRNHTVRGLLRGVSTVVAFGVDRVRSFVAARRDGVPDDDRNESPRSE